MEILAFMRILAKLNTAFEGANPRHSGNKKSFSHANCPEVSVEEVGTRAEPLLLSPI